MHKVQYVPTYKEHIIDVPTKMTHKCNRLLWQLVLSYLIFIFEIYGWYKWYKV